MRGGWDLAEELRLRLSAADQVIRKMKDIRQKTESWSQIVDRTARISAARVTDYRAVRCGALQKRSEKDSE